MSEAPNSQAIIPHDEDQRLDSLRQYEILDSAPECAFDELTQLAAQICATPLAFICFVDQERIWFKSKVGPFVSEMPRASGLSSQVISQRDVVVIPDTTVVGEQHFASYLTEDASRSINFYAAVPLVSEAGFALGALGVADYQPGELTETQRGSLATLSRQIIAQLEVRRNFLSLKRELSERETFNQALRESEERFTKAFNASPEPMIISRLEDGCYLYVNDSYLNLNGVTREEVIGRNALELGLWANPEDSPRLIKMLSEDGRIRKEEIIFRLPSGELRTGLFSAEIIEVGGERCILSLTTDITEHKRTEEALRKSEEYRNLFRLANDAILVSDAKSDVILDVNEKACALYGFPREQFIGRNLKDLSFDEQRGQENNETSMVEGSYQPFEVVHRRADGAPLYFLINHSLIEYDGHRAILSINRDITDRKRAEEQMIHDAFHDPLTGLPNRALFLDHLKLAVERAKRREGNHLFAVLFLDLDRFKVVNDSLGHNVGDQLLITISRRLESCLRPGDTVARLGGDEFTILLDDIKDASDAIRLAKLIQEVLRLPFNLDEHEVFTTVSIGIALSATDYDHPEDLLRDADTAMYRAKSLGKARHEVFDKPMHAHAMELLQLEIDLRRAIERQEFCIHYQPIVSLTSGRISGFEALVRWKHPERGLITPEKFIPVAEETGLIVPIGQLVLSEACRQTRRWQRQFPAMQPLSISVNLSSKQLTQPDLIDQIKQSLQRSGLDPLSLKLEITESVVMENTETAISMLTQLRALQVGLSIDDFGTGYSSLSYLHRFPVGTLKIDRSFVSRLGNNDENGEIVKTIIMLAQNLKMDVVAEGVEKDDQLLHLRNLKCDYAQGYLISKPVDAEGAAKLLSNWMDKLNTSYFNHHSSESLHY